MPAHRWYTGKNTDGLGLDRYDLSILNRAAWYLNRVGYPVTEELLAEMRTLYRPGMSPADIVNAIDDAHSRRS